MGLTRPKYSNIVDSDYKASVRVITTTNITLAGGAPSTYDGLTLSAGDRILVNAQTSGSQNGIYTVTTVGTGSNGTWSRAFDASSSDRVTAGMRTVIGEGTYAGTEYRLTTPDPIVLDTTRLSFLSTAATVSGTSKSVQYNNAGFIAGAANLVYDNVTGNVTVAGTTASVSDSTGALVVKGGVGIAGNVYATGTMNVTGVATFNSNVVIAGNLTTLGNTYITSSTDLAIQDSIINLHTFANLAAWPTNDGKDIGIKFHYYDTSDKHAFIGRSNDTGYLEWYSDGTETTGNVFSGTYGTFKTGNILLSGNTYRGTSTIGSAIPTYVNSHTTQSATPPASPYIGDRWYDTSTDTLYQWTTDGTSSFWIDTLGNPAAINFSSQTTAPSGAKTGDYWYDTSTDTLYTYIFDGVSYNWVDFSSKQPAPATATSSTAGTTNLSTSVSGVLGVPNGGTGSVNFTSGSILVGASTSAITASTLKFDSLTGNLTVPSTTTSGNATTGALVVGGGAGISGNVYAAGHLVSTDTNGNIWVNNTRGQFVLGTPTRDGVARYITNTATGIYSGMSIQRASTELWFTGANQQENYVIRNTGDVISVGANSTVTVNGNIVVSASSISTSTTTGALVVNGGVGIGGALNLTTLTATQQQAGNQYIAMLKGYSFGDQWAFTVGSTTGQNNITSLNSAASAYAPFTVSGSTFTVAAGAGAATALFVASSGNVVVTTTTASADNTSGALVVKGGVGVAGNVNVGGNLTITSNLSVTQSGLFRGPYDENSTLSGVFVGNTGSGTPSPRMGFFNGNTQQNWQIDNYGGEFRWFVPGSTKLTLYPNGNLNATGSVTIGGKKAVNGPAFSAYANATGQTITSGSQQKVLFQTEEFDTDNCYASSRFTPTVEGYYQLNAEVRLDGATGTGEMMIVIWKNGSEYKRGTNQSGTQIASNFWAMTVSSLVYANGTTDYFEIYVQQTSGSSVTVTAVNSSNITWFNGAMVRGA